MSELTTMYGNIQGAFGRADNFFGLHEINLDVIAQLPREDSWPPIVQGMFTVPMKVDGDAQNQGFYKVQMIHFAASFNNFSLEWSKWLEKFESLLKKLYWFEVHLHLSIELHGQFDYSWKVAEEAIKGFHSKPPVAVGTWEFAGGPRKFDW